MPVFTGSAKPLIESAYTIKPDGFNELILHVTTHTGTHLDVPYHLLPNGLSVTDLSVESFVGAAICMRYSGYNSFSVKEFEEMLHAYGKPDFVLFNTGWDNHWNSETYFQDCPLPSSELLDILVGLKIKGVGIDALSIDPIKSSTLENHFKLFAAGCIIIENLTQLDALPEGIFDFYCFPLKITDADGSPVRAVAQIK